MNSKNDFETITTVKLFSINSTVTHQPQLNQSSFFKCEQTDNTCRASSTRIPGSINANTSGQYESHISDMCAKCNSDDDDAAKGT